MSSQVHYSSPLAQVITDSRTGCYSAIPSRCTSAFQSYFSVDNLYSKTKHVYVQIVCPSLTFAAHLSLATSLSTTSPSYPHIQSFNNTNPPLITPVQCSQ